MSYYDKDHDAPTLPPPSDAERAEGRRMFAIDMAVKCRGQYAEPEHIVATAELFLAFVEAAP